MFHDDYLPSFNRSNVKLVGPTGFGVEEVTSRGVKVSNVEHELDLLVFSTGFRVGSGSASSPARNCDIKIIGQSGLSIDEKWNTKGPTTLHKCFTHDFPNLFFSGSSQTGTACEYIPKVSCSTLTLKGNISYVLSNHAEHVAYCIQSARSFTQSQTCTVEHSEEAQEKWADECASMANWFSSFGPCTPGCFNNYGVRITDPEELKRANRGAAWGFGSQDYVEHLEQWRASGSLKNVLVCS